MATLELYVLESTDQATSVLMFCVFFQIAGEYVVAEIIPLGRDPAPMTRSSLGQGYHIIVRGVWIIHLGHTSPIVPEAELSRSRTAHAVIISATPHTKQSFMHVVFPSSKFCDFIISQENLTPQ